MSLKFQKTVRTLRLSQNYLVLIKKSITASIKNISRLHWKCFATNSGFSFRIWRFHFNKYTRLLLASSKWFYFIYLIGSMRMRLSKKIFFGRPSCVISDRTSSWKHMWNGGVPLNGIHENMTLIRSYEKLCCLLKVLA